MSDCILVNPAKSGLFTSLFFTILACNNIFASVWNSVLLGYYSAKLMFILNFLISLVPQVIFSVLLKDPVYPTTYVKPKESGKESFSILLALFKDKQALSMYGLFLNSALGGAILQGILIIFYSMVLRRETITE
jgi:hypothetical protein